jgi:hypothetical protein
MNILRIFASIFLVAVAVMGMFQIASQSNLLADERSGWCCEDGDCQPYKIDGKIQQCSHTVHIKDLNNCGGQPQDKTCGECIDRERAGQLCWLRESNEYCCLVDPENYGGTCPEQYRYYVCPPLSVSISGPDQLDPFEWGTFTAEVSGGTPSFSYQWYKRIECLDANGGEYQDDPDAPPCGEWQSFCCNDPSVQTRGESDFSLKVVVTDDCIYPRVATSLIHYVTVSGSFAKRSRGVINAQASAERQELTYEMTNYPNPFNAGTTIRFSLPEAHRVSIVIYNTHGQQIKNLISNQDFGLGNHTVIWDGKKDNGNDVASGIYLCQLAIGNNRKSLRLALIK